MLSPFPGMNPYLEHPELWAEVHHRLISAIAIQLAPVLRPKYRVAIEKRTYFSEGDRAIDVGIPDVAILTQVRASGSTGSIAIAPDPGLTGLTVTLPIAQEIKEGYLEIREIATGRVVTSLKVLSPTNKRAGVGRDAYEAKRQRVLSSQSHLVELDLLRGGKAMAMLQSQTYDYRILVSRAQQRPQAQLYGFDLPDAMPIVPLPLADQDEEPLLDLRQLLDEIYEQAGFDLTIDYDQPPVPPLSADRSNWLKGVLVTMAATETE